MFGKEEFGIMKDVTVETKFGTLRAYAGSDPHYPEIYIDLRTNRGDLALCVVTDNSINSEDLEEEPRLRVAVYGDPKQEDYTEYIELMKSDIESPEAIYL